MAHFAKVEDGIVTEVLVIGQDVIDTGAFGDPALWVQTSYNTHGGQHPEGRPLRIVCRHLGTLLATPKGKCRRSVSMKGKVAVHKRHRAPRRRCNQCLHSS